ncbi:MAG: ABC transporter substrate-binding protein [Acidobacteria bacterium]|nr:ABC transporter substrate-binding protein [Acidobacteriota bacterium]
MESLSARKSDSSRTKTQELKLAHSTDSDDAFMIYGLATKKIRKGSLSFSHVLEDIESLNQKAAKGIYDITAISFHAYAFLADRYILLPSGASFGDRYGPIVVAQKDLGRTGLRGRTVAIPGKLTTAALALQLFEPETKTVTFPFDTIFDRVMDGSADAGVIIHEGQLTYGRKGLRKIVDLGEWWYQEEKLPLPLGGNAISRQIDAKTKSLVARLLKESIEYALAHREAALEYAMQFTHGLDMPSAERFVSMYVNDWTLDYGPRGRKAVQTLLDRGFEKGIIPNKVHAEFVDS